MATVGAAVIGLVAGGGSALLSGVLAYKAGRRQVKDQGLVAHRQWLCQQRQEAYVAYLDACNAFVGALDECVLSLSTAEVTNDFSLYDGAVECVDVAIYRSVEIRDGDVDHPLGRILMLGTKEVSEQATSLRLNVRATLHALAHLTNALIPDAPTPSDREPSSGDWWSEVESAKDRIFAGQSKFATLAHAALTEFRFTS